MITERISEILDLKGITKYRFCKDLGLSNGFLDKPREITTDKYANILEYLPDISPEWLLTGKGSMLKSPTDALTIASESTVEYGKQNDEIQYLKRIIENQQKIIENQQKELDNKQKIIDKQFNTIEAYEKGKVINVSRDADTPKKGVG